MQLLPPVVTPAGEIALPVADRTAGRLLDAVMLDELAARAQGFTIALADDPPLAIWAVLRAAARANFGLRTVGQLADWLAANWTGELVWPEGARSRSATSSGGQHPPSTWAHLAAAGILAAERCRAASTESLVTSPAYLHGLIHNAADWLRACARDLSREQALACLPPWFATESEAIGTAQSPLSAATSGQNMPPGDAASAEDRQTSQPALNEAARAWTESFLPPDLLSSMLGKLQRLAALETRFSAMLEAEKLDALKELAYGAGHEINNPLANISARAQTLLRGESQPDRRRMLAAINAQAFRAHEMIADMMLFARPPEPKLEQVDLTALLNQLAGELRTQAAEQRTELRTDLPESPIFLRADRVQLLVAIRALCVNALEALVTSGWVEIALQSTSNGRARITVRDNGPGFSDEVRRRLFDPFYSGREAGRGLGFGLPKCWRIAEMHQGTIEVASTPGAGSMFTLLLPLGNTG